MRHLITHDLLISLALIRRNIKVFRSELVGTLIDGAFLIITDVILFGYFLPLMGMPMDNIGPMYIGSIIFMLFFLGENLALRHVFDLRYERFIDYHLTLPVKKRWLFAQYIVSFMIESAVMSIPLLTLGAWLLGDRLMMVTLNIPGLIIIYLLSLIFFGLFFFYLSICSSFDWFMDNIWPRVLSPIYSFGCTVFTWKQLYSISPTIGYLALLNPLTYVSEGMRAAFLGGGEFISVWTCCAVLTVSCVVLIAALSRDIYNQLDPI